MTRTEKLRADELAVIDISEELHSLEVENESLHVLANSLTDYAIIRLDSHGIVNGWSAAAEQIQGYASAEILGKNFTMFFSAEDRMRNIPFILLKDAAAAKNTHHMGWRIRKDGQRFWADVSLTALYDDHDQLTGYVKLVRDLTERHDAEETLRRSEELYRLLVNSVVDYAIIGLDINGIVETWNAGAERIKGYAENEIVGQHFSVFYGQEDQAAGIPARVLDEARSTGHSERSGWRIRKDGSRFWSDVVVTSLYDAEKTLVGYVKITRDLSERHAADFAAEQATKRDDAAAEQARIHQMRVEFMQSISHDLRTPLSAIKGYAWLLRTGKDSGPEERQEFFCEIEAGADRLNAMVDGLLELAKLESGAVELNLEAVSLGKAAEIAVTSLRPLLMARHVEVKVPDYVVVVADELALHRVFVNLIGNAAKFTPKDSTIVIEAHANGSEVVVSVTDEGPGVLDKDKERIFERFSRGSDAATANEKGSGIGLSMVRDYVTLQGGRVWAEDAAGGGARFLFTLPAFKSAVQPCR